MPESITRQECPRCGVERGKGHAGDCLPIVNPYRTVTYIRYPVQVTEEMVEKALDAYRGVTKPRIDAQRMRDALETALKVLLP